MNEFRKWVNPYIALIATKPDYIQLLPFEGSLAESKQRLLARRSNFQRLFLEIGSGSGGHLIELAAQNPDALCVGIELRFKRVFRTAEKSEQIQQKNLLVLHGKAQLISELFDESSIDRIDVNFPDPWDKRIWKKNRLLKESYLQTIAQLLKPSGIFRYKTDHQGYFNDTLHDLEKVMSLSCQSSTQDLYSQPSLLLGNIQTEFEKLFICKAEPICFAEFRRT